MPDDGYMSDEDFAGVLSRVGGSAPKPAPAPSPAMPEATDEEFMHALSQLPEAKPAEPEIDTLDSPVRRGESTTQAEPLRTRHDEELASILEGMETSRSKLNGRIQGFGKLYKQFLSDDALENETPEARDAAVDAARRDLRRVLEVHEQAKQMQLDGAGMTREGREAKPGDTINDMVGIFHAEDVRRFLDGDDNVSPARVWQAVQDMREMEGLIESRKRRDRKVMADLATERKGGELVKALSAFADLTGAPLKGATFGLVDASELGRGFANAEMDRTGAPEARQFEAGEVAASMEGAGGFALRTATSLAEYAGAMPTIGALQRGLARAGVPRAAAPSTALATYSFMMTEGDLAQKGEAAGYGALAPLFGRLGGAPVRGAMARANPIHREMAAEAIGESMGIYLLREVTGQGNSLESAAEDFITGLVMGRIAGGAEKRAGVTGASHNAARQARLDAAGRADAEIARDLAPDRGPVPDLTPKPDAAPAPESIPTPKVVEQTSQDIVGRASTDIDAESLNAGVEAIRGNAALAKPKAVLSAGGVGSLGVRQTVKAAAEAVGRVKQYVVDLPLKGMDAIGRRGLKALNDIVDLPHRGREIRQVMDDVRERALGVPVYRLGQEYLASTAELRRGMDLARNDAKRAVRSLAFDESGKSMTPEQQEIGTKWFEGDASDAEVAASLGEGKLKELQQFKRNIMENQAELERLGWLTADELAEWGGNWLPRVFAKIETARRAVGGGTFTSTGSKKTPEKFRRRSRFDVSQDGEAVGSFKTEAEAQRFVEDEGKKFAADQAKYDEQWQGLETQASEIESRLPPEVLKVTGRKVDTADGGAQIEVKVLEKGKIEPTKHYFDDPVQAEDFQGRLEDQRAQRTKSMREVARLREEAAALKKARPTTKFEVQEPLSQERLEELGVIRDPAVLVARALATQGATIETMRFLDRVSKNANWASPEKTDVYTEQMPGDPRKYGPMAGKWVHPKVRQDLVGMLGERTMADKVGQLMDGFLNAWKLGKTAGRPASHGRNVIGNVLVGELAGFSFLDPANLKHLTEATRILRSKPGDPQYEVLRFLIKEGVAGGDFLSTEVLDLADDVMRYRGGNWNERINAYIGDRFQELKSARVTEAAPVGGDVMRLLAVAYRIEDVMPKMGDFVRRVRSGTSPEVAAREVRENWPQYDEALTQRFMNKKGFAGATLRQVAPPFLTFTTEAFRLLGRHIQNRPVTLSAIVLALKEAGRMLARASGFDDDEIEEMNRGLPQHRKIGLTGWMIPSRGENGELRMLDNTYSIPLADEFESLLKAFDGDPDALQSASGQSGLTGPFVSLGMQLIANKQFFKDRAIDRSDGRGGFTAVSRDQGIRDKLAFIADTMLPNIWPGGRDWRVVTEMLEGRAVSRDGRVRSPLLTLLDVGFGVKVNQFDPEKDAAAMVGRIDTRIGKKMSRVSEISRDMEAGKLTREEGERELAELKGDILGLVNHGLWIVDGRRIFEWDQLPKEVRDRFRKRLGARVTDSVRGRNIGRNLGLDENKRRTLRDALNRPGRR